MSAGEAPKRFPNAFCQGGGTGLCGNQNSKVTKSPELKICISIDHNSPFLWTTVWLKVISPCYSQKVLVVSNNQIQFLLVLPPCEHLPICFAPGSVSGPWAEGSSVATVFQVYGGRERRVHESCPGSQNFHSTAFPCLKPSPMSSVKFNKAVIKSSIVKEIKYSGETVQSSQNGN